MVSDWSDGLSDVRNALMRSKFALCIFSCSGSHTNGSSISVCAHGILWKTKPAYSGFPLLFLACSSVFVHLEFDNTVKFLVVPSALT